MSKESYLGEAKTLASETRSPILNQSQSILRNIINHITLARDAIILSSIISLIVVLIHTSLNFKSIMAIIGIGLGYGLGFATNDFFDAPFDKLDNRKGNLNFFIKNKVTNVTKVILIVVLAVLFLIFGLFGLRGIVALIFSIAIIISYSMEPIRFKRRPGFDILIHGVFVEVYPWALTLYLLQLDWLPIDKVALPILFLNSCINQIEQQKRDYTIDRISHKTFVVEYGKNVSSKLIKILNVMIFVILIIGLIYQAVPNILIPQIIIALPLTLHRFVVGPEENRSASLYNYSLYATIIYWLGVILYFLTF